MVLKLVWLRMNDSKAKDFEQRGSTNGKGFCDELASELNPFDFRAGVEVEIARLFQYLFLLFIHYDAFGN